MFKKFQYARRNPWGLSLLGIVGAFMAGRLAEKHRVSGSSLLQKLSSYCPSGHSTESGKDSRDHESK